MARKEHGSPKFKMLYNPRRSEQPARFNNPADTIQAGSSDEQSYEAVSTPRTPSSCSSSVESDEESDEETEEESRSTPLVQSHTATTTSDNTATTRSDLTATTMSEFTSSILDSETDKPAMVSAQTSTRTLEHCFHPGVSWYHHMQGIDSVETNHHFHSGDILTSDLSVFRILFGKYVCAFLNSPGGAIYYGVTKKGLVTGFSHTRRLEDAIRIEIDTLIKRIQPCVPISAYNINFAMVMDDTGQIVPGLRVLVVKILDKEFPSESEYTFKGVPYTWENNRVKIP